MAGVRIRLTDLQPVTLSLDKFARFLNTPTVALKRIGAYQERQYQKAFDANRTPEGQPWPKLAPSTIASKRNPKMLVEAVGRIPASLFHQVKGGTVEVGYGDPLAAIHHEGARTRPHKIVPKNKKALYWKGASHPVRSVNHPGSTLPARGLVGFSPQDVAEWQAITEEEAVKLWEG